MPVKGAFETIGQDDRARRLQLGDDPRIVIGHRALQGDRSPRARQALGVDPVVDENRDAVELCLFPDLTSRLLL